jgi:hypothetical protein
MRGRSERVRAIFAASQPVSTIPPQDITPFHHGGKALAGWLTKSHGPALAGPLCRINNNQ